VSVITGFFGRSPEGKTATFGRGGSDYSAAVVAHALGLPTVEVWKDVGGFMSADPNPCRRCDEYTASMRMRACWGALITAARKPTAEPCHSATRNPSRHHRWMSRYKDAG